MATLLNALETVVMDGLLRDHLPLTMRSTVGQGILALAGGFIVLGFGGILYGAYLWLLVHYTPQTAAMATGGLSLVLALVILGLAMLALCYQQRRVNALRRSISKRAQDGMAALDEELGDSIRANPKLALLLGALGGFALEKRLL